MLKRMPVELNGRMVHLQTVDGACDKPDDVYKVIHANQDPGIWYRIRLTMDIPAQRLKKLYSSVAMRMWTHGMEKMVAMRVTEVDGICFQWQGVSNAPGVREEAHAKHLVRTGKRVALNKARRRQLKAEKEGVAEASE